MIRRSFLASLLALPGLTRLRLTPARRLGPYTDLTSPWRFECAVFFNRELTLHAVAAWPGDPGWIERYVQPVPTRYGDQGPPMEVVTGRVEVRLNRTAPEWMRRAFEAAK